MNEKPTHEFKIRLDDGLAEQDEGGKPSSKKTDAHRKDVAQKPVRRAPWVLYLLFGVLIAAMVTGYFDIRNRLLSMHSSGSRETQHLSEDLQSKFSNLAIKFSNMEASLKDLSEAQTGLNGSVASLKDELAKTNKSIASINSSKADKKSLATSMANIQKELDSLTESVKKNTAESAVMSAKLKAELTNVDTVTAKVSEDLNALKALVTAVQADKAGKKDLLTEIDHVENVLKANQAQSDKQVAGVLQSIQRLDMRVNALEVKAGLPSGSSSDAAAATQSNAASGETTSETKPPSLPDTGELIERDITH